MAFTDRSSEQLGAEYPARQPRFLCSPILGVPWLEESKGKIFE
jgi:hypothetical protein